MEKYAFSCSSSREFLTGVFSGSPFFLVLIVFWSPAFGNGLTKIGEKSSMIKEDVPAAGTMEAMEGGTVTGTVEVVEKGPVVVMFKVM